jgi:hypothetical protein
MHSGAQLRLSQIWTCVCWLVATFYSTFGSRNRLEELQKLCEAGSSDSDEVALNYNSEELGQDLNILFPRYTTGGVPPVLGQVYRQRYARTGRIWRSRCRDPICEVFSLDLFLLQKIGVLVDVLQQPLQNQPPFPGSL